MLAPILVDADLALDAVAIELVLECARTEPQCGITPIDAGRPIFSSTASLTTNFLVINIVSQGWRCRPSTCRASFEAAILSRMRSPRDLALELGKGQQHVEGEAAHRGGGVELLG